MQEYLRLLMNIDSSTGDGIEVKDKVWKGRVQYDRTRNIEFGNSGKT